MKPIRTRSVRRSFRLIEGLVALLLGFLALQVYLQWQASHRGVQALARLETGAIPGLKLVAELEENLILYRLRSYELMFVPEQQRPAKTAEADALRETLRRVLSDLGDRLPDETARRHRARLEQGLTNYFALDSRIRSTLDKDFQAAMDLLDKEVPAAVRQLEEASHTLQQHCSDYASHETRDTVTAFADTKATVVVMNAVGMAFALAVLVLVAITSRGIRAALVDVAHRLSDGSRRTGELAGTVASASHVLAEGASEQAAAIEETGASLEEMASMTAQSASNAAAVHECMQKEAAENFARIEDRLRRMDETLTLTLAAGHETAKVIRVIDEIAFQTNILALNAAVEAARAGDAGLGFAVVADEVRNLAQRSASAAKSTQGMVENSTLRLKELAAHFREISDALGTNTALGRKISELVAQISVASQEQAQGIRQITSAVAGMEKITQQNVAHAQSSTAAAHDLHEQADHVQDTVAGLMGLVDGRGTPAEPDSPSSTDHAVDHTHAHAAPANGAARPSRPGPGSHGAARERFTFVPASPAPGGANGETPTVLHG